MGLDSETILTSWLRIAEHNRQDGRVPPDLTFAPSCVDDVIQLLTLRFQESPFSTHIGCQLVGFEESGDSIVWIEIMESESSARFLRHSVEADHQVSTLVANGFVASRLSSLLLRSLPSRWSGLPLLGSCDLFTYELAIIGPEIMFGGESATFWIKRESDVRCFKIHFLEDGCEAHQAMRFLSKLVRYGNRRLRLLCLFDAIKSLILPRNLK